MIPTENYYKMSNSIFGYGLTPIQFTVFSYLVCAGGRKEVSWYSVKNIAACCSCSEETARKALHELAEMKFIEIEPRFLDKHGARRQTSNNYYILTPLRSPQSGMPRQRPVSPMTPPNHCPSERPACRPVLAPVDRCVPRLPAGWYQRSPPKFAPKPALFFAPFCPPLFFGDFTRQGHEQMGERFAG